MTTNFTKEQAAPTAKSHARFWPTPRFDETNELDDVSSVTQDIHLNGESHCFTWTVLVHSGMLDAKDRKRVSCTMYHVWALGCQHQSVIASSAYALQQHSAQPVTVPGGRADLSMDMLSADEFVAMVVDYEQKEMDSYDKVCLQDTCLRGSYKFALNGSLLLAEVWPETPSTTVPPTPSLPASSIVSIEALEERSDDFGSQAGVQMYTMDDIACVVKPTCSNEESSRCAWTVFVNRGVLDANDHKRVSCAMYHLWALGCHHLG